MTHASPLGRASAALAARNAVGALIVILGLAALFRFAFAFRTPVFLLHDSGSYYLPAHNLIHGLGFDLSIRRTPIYPAFLAGIIAYFGEELTAVVFAQHLLGLVSICLVYLLGRLTFGHAAGLLAALLTALDGTLLVSEHYVMPETLFVTLVLGTLLAAVVAIRRRSAPWFLAAGALLGVSALCKPIAQALLPVIPFVALVSFGSWRRTVLPVAVFVAGFLIATLPWIARNYVVHGTATTAGALGQTLIARTAKHDSGFRYYDPRGVDEYGDQRETTARQIVQSGISQRLSDGVIYRRVQERLRLTDTDANAFMRDLATKVIVAQPLYYLQGSGTMSWQLLVGEVEKLRTDWKSQNARLTRDEWEERVEHLLARPSQVHHNEFERADSIVGIYQPGTLGPLLPILALVGLLAAATRAGWRPGLLAGLAALALIVASAALDGPVARYRYPADPLIALTAVGGLVALWKVGTVLVGRRWQAPRRAVPLWRRGQVALTPTRSQGERGLETPSPPGSGLG